MLVVRQTCSCCISRRSFNQVTTFLLTYYVGLLYYKSCIDKEGREFDLIPADDLSDLSPTDSFKHLSGMKKMKPFAPHFIILEDAALYGHGDIMTLNGTAHYLGTCRQYGSTGFDTINVTRHEVAGFIFEPVLNLVTLWTDNLLHTMISFLPRYLSLLPMLKKYPNIIVAKNMFLTKAQVYIEPILNFYGIHSNNWIIKPLTNQYNPTGKTKTINFMNIEYGKVYFMKTLIAPISTCKFIPKKAVAMIRTAVHSIYALNSTTIPQTSIIISDRREMEELYNELSKLYGTVNVKKYSTKLDTNPLKIHKTFEKTVRMFHKCKLFISAYGAALTNIMFMNPGSSVIEIRPETSLTWYFSQLSSLVKVNYQTSWTEKATNITSGSPHIMKFSVNDVIEKALVVMGH